jgi:hypothetical protein
VGIVETTVLVKVTVTVSWVPGNVFVGAFICEKPVVSENPAPRKGCSGGGEDGCGWASGSVDPSHDSSPDWLLSMNMGIGVIEK